MLRSSLDFSGVKEFSDHLFWDVDRASVDLVNHGSWLMGRVLEYGKWSDWKLLEKLMGEETMLALLPQLVDVSAKSLAFARARLGAEALR